MISIADLFSTAASIDGGFRSEIPTGWLQGRTAYGGFTAAMALHAALLSEPDLPPLRSAQISFIGPLAGEVSVTATRLRRGRNAAFVQVDVASDGELGLRAIFVFVTSRASAITFDQRIAAGYPPPSDEDEVYVGPEGFFTNNFEFHEIDPKPPGAAWLRWSRLRERQGLHPAVELMVMADALPPAALRLLGSFAPLSSLTWIVNLLDPRPVTTDGWWLLSARTDHAHEGLSSQRMQVWNSDGTLVAEGMQSVVIFA